MSTEEKKDPHKLERATSYIPINQGKTPICGITTLIELYSHDFCTKMGWVTKNYKMKKSFDLNSNCDTECGMNRDSPECKCCLLRIYIRTIISNKFSIEDSVDLKYVINFVNFSLNEILVLDNLPETIGRHLSGEQSKHFEDFINIFSQIKSNPLINYITTKKFVIEKGILYNDKKNRIYDIRYLKHLLKSTSSYASFDEAGPVSTILSRATRKELLLSTDISVFFEDDPEPINNLMTEYNDKIPMMKEALEEVKEKVKGATETNICEYLLNSHAMVLQTIFFWRDKPMLLLKNSGGTKIGIKGYNVVPVETILNADIEVISFFEDYVDILDKETLLSKLAVDKSTLNLTEAKVKEENTREKIHKLLEEIKDDGQNENEEEIMAQQQAHQQAQQQLVNQQLVNPPLVNKKRGLKGLPNSLLNLSQPPFKKGGNRYSKKIRRKKSGRFKRQKRKKTIKHHQRMRKTRSKK